MEITVSLPSLLANCTGGARDVTVEAATLQGSIDALLAGWPLLRPHLLDERGRLREHVNLFLNDQNVRWIDDWNRPLSPGDTVTVIQAVSGGVDDPVQRRNLWLAAFAVALCYGFSAYFVTGDSGKGGAFFLLVMAIFAALLLFLPNRLTSGKPLSDYYKTGLVVLLGPFVVLAIGHQRTPWNDLEARYATDRARPAGRDAYDEVVLVEPVGEFMVKPRSFKSATTTIADDGVYLALGWPLRMIYDPVWVPATAITHCRTSEVDTMYTSLKAELVGARIEVLDPSEDLLEWCAARGIPGQKRPFGLRRADE